MEKTLNTNLKIISPFFKAAEFECDGKGCLGEMNSQFLTRLMELRTRCELPFKITSSWRSADKNRAVGGAVDSMHLQGRAVDIACTDSKSRAVIVREALKMGLTVGVMERAIHIDDRSEPIVFHYYHLYRR